MPDHPGIETGQDDLIAAYKTLLRDYLARRPSGTRQKIAKGIGTHKSFVSQVTNPAYRVPLPAPYVPVIMGVCHFSPEERAAFTAAYEAAHPGSLTVDPPAPNDRGLWIALPDFDNPQQRRQVEAAIRDTAERIIALAKDLEGHQRPQPEEQP